MKRRRSGRRRTRLLGSLALTAILVVVPGAVYAWGSQSSSFNVRHVRVQGAERISAERAAALLRHAFVGRNLFRIGSDDVERSLRPLGLLASAEVDRDFPSTLVVRITEHTPALFALAGKRWYLISAEGRVLSDLGRERRARTAALRGGPPKTSLRLPTTAAKGALEERTTARDAAVRGALALLRVAPSELTADLAVVRTTATGLRLRTRKGTVVEIGRAEQLRAKCAATEAVLRFYRARKKQPTFIDVSIPDRPVGRPDV